MLYKVCTKEVYCSQANCIIVHCHYDSFGEKKVSRRDTEQLSMGMYVFSTTSLSELKLTIY